MKAAIVVGTRPNFVKAQAVVAAFARRGVTLPIIHTGQHYDAAMSDEFFAALELPEPAHHLGVGPGTRGEQLGEIVTRLARLLPALALDELIVVGDVTSTAAAAIAADAADVPVAHVEAGLRSFDDTMPEERNRKLVDAVARHLFVSEPSGVSNLRREGADSARVHLVGNVMIDTLERFRGAALARRPWEAFGVAERGYVLATLHRPGNVDSAPALAESLAVLALLARERPVLFAAHPRTAKRLEAFGLTLPEHVRLLPPFGYLDFIGMMASAWAVLTDSGGAQEETTALGVPCLTMRENTERPVTCELGTSRLVGRSVELVRAAVDELVRGVYPAGQAVPLWDGRAGDRIADLLLAGAKS